MVSLKNKITKFFICWLTYGLNQICRNMYAPSFHRFRTHAETKDRRRNRIFRTQSGMGMPGRTAGHLLTLYEVSAKLFFHTDGEPNRVGFYVIATVTAHEPVTFKWYAPNNNNAFRCREARSQQ